jgi:hypothetical protein
MPSTTHLRWLTVRLALFLAAGLVLFGTAKMARSDEDLDEVKRRLKIEADQLEAKVKERVAEADKVGKVNPSEAIGLLGSLETTLAITKALTPERKQELQEFIAARIKHYRQASLKAAPGAGYEERMAHLRARQREIEAKNEDLKQMNQQISQLLKQGKYKEAGAIGEQWRQKYPDSPGADGFEKINRAGSALRELQSIRDQRSARYARAQAEFMKSMLPVVGDIEFPADWAEKTKRRTQIKLDPKEVKLLKALQTPISTTIKAQPLEAVLNEFEKRHGIQINIDPAALEAAGLNRESPVSLNAREKPLRSSLKNMLGDIGLTYIIRNGELRVTTPQLASQDMVTKVYYIGDLVQGTNFALGPLVNQLQAIQSIAAMIKMIESIEPASWQSGGGAGVITFDPSRMALIVKQSAEMQFMLQGALR